jgi:hypothetical protein
MINGGINRPIPDGLSMLSASATGFSESNISLLAISAKKIFEYEMLMFCNPVWTCG